MAEEGLKQMMTVLPAGPKIEKDFRHMLDDKSIDAVAIAAPDHWHACMAVMTLAAGKHVYLEKPFAYDIGDGKAVIATAQKHPKLVLQVGTQHRAYRSPWKLDV